jgi:hypothetical protein
MGTLQRMPSTGASTASLSSSFHTYVANCQPARVRSMKRVSARRANRNSFQSRVPRGNCQTSGFDASMNFPGGMWSHRDFAAPSDHRGYWGVNGRLPGAIVRARQSA